MKRKQYPIPRPVLKWAGGKSSSTQTILSRMPKRIGTYYEPFFGGGAVFFALCRAGRIKRAVLTDTNRELITTMKVVRDHVSDLLVALQGYADQPVTEDRYLHIRETTPITDVSTAARMIFLNKTCYNGLYRVNKSGKFNSPWGAHERFVVDVANLCAASEALQCADIKCQPFYVAADDAQKHDVVYLDPPYFPSSDTADFAAYTSKGFTLADQMRTAATFVDLASQKVTVLASNADVPQARGLYGAIPNIEVVELSCARAVNSDGTKRGRVGELLFVANGRRAA